MIKTQEQLGGRRPYRAVILSFRRPLAVLAFLLLLGGAFLLAQQLIRRVDGAEPPAKKADPKRYAWRDLFDGKTLGDWKSAQFGGEGEVKVADGAITLEMGNSMTGIVYSGKLPTMNYELSLEGKRTSGNDFFCTTTFPVDKSHCSLVVGGWAGTVVGISCIDFYDASDNATTKFMDFKNNRWYKVRIRVTKPKLEAWIDDEQVLDFETEGHRLSLRDECEPCKPFGVATWVTSAAVRNIRLRDLAPDELE